MDQRIDQKVLENLKGVLPVLETVLRGGHSAFTGLEREQVDQEFGSGAWDSLLRDPLDKVWGFYREKNPTLLADRDVIHREVNMLKGELFDKLVEFREGSRKAKADKEAEQLRGLTEGVLGAVEQRTNLTGGLRRMDSGEPSRVELERVTQFLKERERAIGEEAESAKDFLRRTSYGNTYKDYLEHQEKLKGKGG